MGLVKKIVGFPSFVKRFLKEVRLELKKVTWSTKEELIAATGVVIVASAFLTAYIAVIDFCASKIMRFIIQ